MPTSRTAVRVLLSAVLSLTLVGCVSTSPASDEPSPASPRSADPSPAPSSDTIPAQGEQMKIQITINGQRLHATIFDSAAGRDLIAQLPFTIDMTDHGSVEKTGSLPAPLSPDGAAPGVGDVGYYAPGNDFVLYYGDQSYHPGIVIIGRLDGDAAGRLADMDGGVTATVERRAA